jgi:secreted trypsin-like serine protease
MKRAFLMSLAVGAVMGCSSPPKESAETSTNAILGGKEDPNDPSVVAIYAKVPGADKGGLCTGEVVSPTVVLTAAHCTLEDEIGEGAVWHVIPGPGIKDVPEDQWLEVEKVDHDPAFDINNVTAGHDVGVIVLKKPTDIKPLKVNRKPLDAAQVGQNVRLVGYGLDDGINQTGAGIKREVEVPIDGLDKNLIETGTFMQGSCNGDSGGPAFLNIDGEETIVGVTSYGFAYCLYHGYYTDVGAYGDFLDQYLPK